MSKVTAESDKLSKRANTLDRTKPKHFKRWRRWGWGKQLVFLFLGLPIIGYVLVIILAIADTIWIDNVQPINPHSSRIEKRRESTGNEIDKIINSITDNSGLTAYTQAIYDVCDTGQNNYKVNDGFASRCFYTKAFYYGIRNNNKHLLPQIEQVLNKNQWHDRLIEQKSELDPPDPFGDDLDNYQEELKDPAIAHTGWGTSRAYYKKDYELKIEIQHKQQYYKNVDPPYSYGHVGGYYKNEDPFDTQKVFKTIAKDNEFIVTIGITRIYASKPSLRDGLL